MRMRLAASGSPSYLTSVSMPASTLKLMASVEEAGSVGSHVHASIFWLRNCRYTVSVDAVSLRTFKVRLFCSASSSLSPSAGFSVFSLGSSLSWDNPTGASNVIPATKVTRQTINLVMIHLYRGSQCFEVSPKGQLLFRKKRRRTSPAGTQLQLVTRNSPRDPTSPPSRS